MLSAGHFVAINIPVGDHVTRSIGGLKFNLDTIWNTVVAGVIVIGLGLYMSRRASKGVPSRLQIFWELIVGAVSDQVEANLGPKYRRVVPLAVTIFVVILTASWLEILPGLFHNTDYSPAPSADVNFTYALGLLVFILFTAAGFREHGFVGYLSLIVGKPRWMGPFHIINELVKPLTLALRLFGNLFAGGIMIALLISFPIAFFPASIAFTVLWKMFDMFIGLIQAFIFSLLTILYFQFATAKEAH